MSAALVECARAQARSAWLVAYGEFASYTPIEWRGVCASRPYYVVLA
jgi:hypothetical protein